MKSKEEMIRIGSATARNGFKNEDDIIIKFNNWKSDEDTQIWLNLMGYKLDDIEKVIAIKLHGYKTDVQVQVTIILKQAIDAQNISIKLVSNPTGFNQVDKRWVKDYAVMWEMPENIVNILKQFTGEISSSVRGRDNRRIFLNELCVDDQKLIVDFFMDKKTLIVADILKGRGQFSANWMLVALKSSTDTRWVLKSMNQAIYTFSKGDVAITNLGSLKIGRVTMQRKGGDGGRHTANMLQFKINPIELFNE